MTRTFCSTLILVTAFISCTNPSNSNQPTQSTESIANPTPEMKNLVSIVEIPTSDFARAVTFYKAVLNVSIEEVDMGGVKMGVLPGDGTTVSVALVGGADYKPSMEGALVYFNAGDDLQIILDKIESNGGQIIVPKTEISPEMGFFALFTDTEGNKVGLHSAR